MNERIRELAKQAGFKLIRENCYDIASTMSVQEFAELIVLECLSYAKDGDIDFMKFMIKKHFGVE